MRMSNPILESFTNKLLNIDEPYSFLNVINGNGDIEEKISNVYFNKITEELSKDCFQTIIKNNDVTTVFIIGIRDDKYLPIAIVSAWKFGGCVLPMEIYEDPRAESLIESISNHYTSSIVILSDTEMVLPWMLKYVFINIKQRIKWKPESEYDFVSKNSTSSSFNNNNNNKQTISHLIFTSGTTGRPKAVMVSHQSLYQYALCRIKHSELTNKDRLFIASSFTFDPYLGDLVTAMVVGCSIVVPREKKIIVNGNFANLLIQSETTHLITTPFILLNFLGDNYSKEDFSNKKLKQILVGGERMPITLVEKSIQEWKGFPKLFNIYGVTECTVYQSQNEIVKLGDESELGVVYSDGVKIFLLDFVDGKYYLIKDNKEGEIVMSGIMVGEKYLDLNDEKNTSNGFLNNVTVYDDGMKIFFEKIYKTGDVGVMNKENGKIKLIGRKDTQVKINGVRMELYEIENEIVMNLPLLIKKCVVGKKKNENRLYCFLSLIKNKEEEEEKQVISKQIKICANCVVVVIKHVLFQRLPVVMIPSLYYCVENFPTNVNGKIDRQQLIELADNQIEEEEEEEENKSKITYEEDEENILTNFEKTIANIWEETLELSKNSVEATDSFQSIGGDSLTALRAVNAIIKTLMKLDENNEAFVKAFNQALVNGEITGVLSPFTLLSSKSLKSYCNSILYGCNFIIEKVDNNEKQQQKEEEEEESLMKKKLLKAIHDACKINNIALIKTILNFNLFPIDGQYVPRKNFCRTPLHDAVAFGNLETVEFVLNEGANVMACTNKRMNVLHFVCFNNQLEVLSFVYRKICEKVINPCLMGDANDQTCIHFLCRVGNLKGLKWVLDFEKNERKKKKEEIQSYLDNLDRWRRSSLYWCVLNENLEMLKYLLENGASKNPKGTKPGQRGINTHLIQESLLELAVRRNCQVELIELLK